MPEKAPDGPRSDDAEIGFWKVDIVYLRGTNFLNSNFVSFRGNKSKFLLKPKAKRFREGNPKHRSFLRGYKKGKSKESYALTE